MTIEKMLARLSDISEELRGFDPEALTEDQEARFDTLTGEAEELRGKVEQAEERAQKVEELRSAVETGRAKIAAGEDRGVPNVIIKKDPTDILSDRNATRTQLADAATRALEGRVGSPENMAHVREVLLRHSGDDRWARNIIGRSTDVYERAWAKMVTGGEYSLTAEERTALSVGSNTNGGFLVPTHLDPTIILTNSGSSNVVRGLSRVVTLTEGNTWYGVSSAGVTASFDAELTEVSDDSPTFGQVSVPVHKAQAFVQASVEALQDIGGLASDVMMLFADAKDRVEGAAHATGTGTNQPTGIFTALDANTNVEITSTTAATIGEVDIHSVYRQTPVRFRGNGTWLMNPLYSLAVKRLGTAVSSSYSGDLTAPVSDRILGRPQVESDDAPTTQTTTVRDNEIVFGDFSNYVIADKPGSLSVAYIPPGVLQNATSNLPDGRVGWYAYWRTGADSVNDVAFRMLQDATSA